jgi:hypothetical protein
MTTSFLFLFPLTFISNIFVDPATMPGWLQVVVAVNPGVAPGLRLARVDARRRAVVRCRLGADLIDRDHGDFRADCDAHVLPGALTFSDVQLAATSTVRRQTAGAEWHSEPAVNGSDREQTA